MSQWIVPPVGIIEPVPAPEIYTDGIGAIEISGENVVCYFIRDQLTIENPHGERQRVLVAKLIRPLASVPVSIGQLAQCCFRTPPMTGFKPKIV